MQRNQATAFDAFTLSAASLFLPGRFFLLLVDLVVGVIQVDLRVRVGQTGRDDVQLQIFVVLLETTQPAAIHCC